MEQEAPRSPIEQVETVVDGFKYGEIRGLLKKERKGRSAWLKDWDALPDSDKKRECEAALNFPGPGEEARASEMTRVEAVIEALNPYLTEEEYRIAITIFERLLNKVRKADSPHEAHLDLHYEVFEEQEGRWVYDPQASRTPIVPLMTAALDRCVQELGWSEMIGEPDEGFLEEARQIIEAISLKNKEVVSGNDFELERIRIGSEVTEIKGLLGQGNPRVWPYLLREELSGQMGELPAIEGVPVLELRENNVDLRRQDFPPGYKFNDYEVVDYPEPRSGAARRVFFAKGKERRMVAIGVFGHGIIENEPIDYKRYFAIKGSREDFEIELWVRKALENNGKLFPLVHPLAGVGKIIWGEGEEAGIDDSYFTIEPYLQEGEGGVFTVKHALANPQLLAESDETTKEIFADQQRVEVAAAQYLLDLFSFYDYFLNSPFNKHGEEMIVVPRDIKVDQVYFRVGEGGIRPYLRDFNLFKLIAPGKKGLIARELGEDFSVIRQTAVSIVRAFGLTELGRVEKGEYYIGEPKEGVSREMGRFIVALQELEKTWTEELGGEFGSEEKKKEKGDSGFSYEMILALMEESGLIEETPTGYRVKERFTY